MKTTIVSSFKLAAGLAFLIATSQAHASVSPPPDIIDFDFGALSSGVYTKSLPTPDRDPSVLWFQFELNADSLVNITTLGSTDPQPEDPNDDEFDTVLALYDDAGALLGQNDDCGSGGTRTSCLQFPSLAAGDYIAGVTGYPGSFLPDWMLSNAPFTGGKDVVFELTVRELPVSAVPVPAAIWLFGSALIGFVGMSRRTSVKS
jgi:hypothetical protein